MTKIMLVEDDKSLREIYGVRLLAEGYDIVSAGDGEEALAMAIKERPDLILSDVMMPKISGFDMLDILRSTTETKGIKVIMMTALSSDEQRQRGEQLGADMYLVKSQVGIEDAVKAVHQVLNDKPSSTPNPATATVTPASSALPTTPPDAPVTDVTDATTIPEPTAPFSGQRPSTLGERIIQPLKDNPRVSNVDVSELIDKEFSTTLQSVENVPDGASSAVPPMEVLAPPPTSVPLIDNAGLVAQAPVVAPPEPFTEQVAPAPSVPAVAPLPVNPPPLPVEPTTEPIGHADTPLTPPER